MKLRKVKCNNIIGVFIGVFLSNEVLAWDTFGEDDITRAHVHSSLLLDVQYVVNHAMIG